MESGFSGHMHICTLYPKYITRFTEFRAGLKGVLLTKKKTLKKKIKTRTD